MPRRMKKTLPCPTGNANAFYKKNRGFHYFFRMQRKSQFKTQDIPRKPGVYLFRNSAGRVIYVGKAKNLRNRLSSYFQPSRSRTADPKTRSLIRSIEFYEIHLARTESEALLLESKLIKEYSPFFNVELRDDKRYMLICVDPSESFPRLKLVRLKRNDGRIYYGPFPHASVLRRTVEYLSKRFGLRTCNVASPTEETCRHCLDHIVRKCSCPCLGKVSAVEYDGRLKGAMGVLEGDVDDLVAELDSEMRKHAEKHRFEDAAQCRDMIDNLRKVCRFGRMRTYQRTPSATPASPENACDELAAVLGVQAGARRIECFDISTIGGSFSVGSMVCFVDGRPFRSGYRRFKVRSVEGVDDFAMMREVVSRRYRRLLEQGEDAPDLVIVDGGKGQLSAAISGLADSGHRPLAMIGLAKRQEEVFLPGESEPLVLERHHPGLRLIQAVRDEAHRFAISYHKKLRSQRISDSILHEIPGIGPSRRDALLKAFGSVRRLRRADAQEISERVPGVGPELAAQVVEFLANSKSQSRGAE